ncbi:MAG TPA: energy transducer TonB [Mucilaginibacter sp.]|jgi:outer membrane biosynthesis protein TonB|nr:energy transducer TonB [Mucilaginibacter sp.]
MKKLLLLPALCLLFAQSRAQTADTTKHPPLPANGADPDNSGKTPAGDDHVYATVSKSPRFPGGMDSLHRFLSKNIVYPPALLSAHKSGMVIVHFVVEKDSSLSHVYILRSPDDAFSAEVLRVFTPMKWMPGSLNGRAVRVEFTAVVRFDPDMPGLF